MKNEPLILYARRQFHRALLNGILTLNAKGVPNIADKDSKTSVTLAKGIVQRLGGALTQNQEAGQTAGKQFEEAVGDYLRGTFLKLNHLRPGDWEVRDRRSGKSIEISNFEQYDHLAKLMEMIEADPGVSAALGADYLITPDVVILRRPETEERLNTPNSVVGESHACLTPLRKINRSTTRTTAKGKTLPHETLLLHASVSCKWTLRSDRAQNARSEALNLIRNRKGRVPHIVAITAEPLPSRLSSLALGTSDLDCVYHIALPELTAAVDELAKNGRTDQHTDLATLVNGKRLRDISDLPLDLVI
jgi:NgoMIV restriction enzyme